MPRMSGYLPLMSKRALVIGASGGVGSALAAGLEERGYSVRPLSRSEDGFDITDEARVDELLRQETGPYELILIATGGLEVEGAPPEKSLRAVRAKSMQDQFAVNTIGPALILRHASRLLPRADRSVIAALSARVGSISDNRLGGWVSYRAAKAALNQVIRTAAIELSRTHPKSICVSLHPGTVETGLTRKYLSRHPAVPPAQAATNLLQVIDGLTPPDTGQFFDWAGKRVEW